MTDQPTGQPGRRKGAAGGGKRDGGSKGSGETGRSGAGGGDHRRQTGSAGQGSHGSAKRSGGGSSRTRDTKDSGGVDGGRSSGSGRGRPDPTPATKRRRDLTGAAANLPNWVIEELARVTPAGRVAGALEELGEASEAMAEGAYKRAVRHATRAKDLAPRDATVRETLGIAAYRSGDWRTALAELRTYRRLAGETTHLPVEMDALRALDRPGDVESSWKTLQERGGKPAVLKEGRVVYASHLIDRGELDRAWELVDPGAMKGNPFEEDLRLWYVAARVAALRGDVAKASAIRSAILGNDPAFPGIDELEKLIAHG